MITITNLDKSFSEKVILSKINVEFKNEMISVVVGKSGEGKTTLFRIIADLETYDSGEITFCEEDKIGMVFQSNQLYPHLSVINNLVLPQRVIMKIPKELAINNAIKVLSSLGIEDLKDQYPSSLSGGEEQRVAIARALVINKNILLLDEPTSALDSENTTILINLLKDLKRAGKTIIIITHDSDFAKKVSDYIYELRDSKLNKIA
ncbi:MAG: ATP-binding cassette domain-containing protein [Candidatus Izemoplasma sp.]